MKSLKKILLSLTIGLVVFQTGCGVQTNSKNIDNTKTSQEKIISEFKTLTSKDSKPQEVIKFIDDNIADLSKEDASSMIISLEENLKKNLPIIEDKFYKTKGIQEEMRKVYEADFDIRKIDSIEGKELKELLVETRDSGYRVEAAEGVFFPIINYEFYKKYSSYVSSDIKEYIDIMAVESNNVPAKDAALMIGWEEIIARALNQEKFINTYKESTKVNDIKGLYKNYLTFALIGANNTPLFNYDTNIIVPEAKEAYLNAIKKDSDSIFIKTLKDFMEVLEKDNYKLTEAVNLYRKNIVNN
ncbi:hypothetical protein GCM10008905_11130 [Clostridium malenominatum]|uniref:Lipoprotein n=1 Tax=Clostridium malenominatum TaxID=1539 RepID=A0ABN1ITP1_9CLOT